MNATRLNEATQPTGYPHPLLAADHSPHEHTDDNATYLPELTRECERRGFALQLTEDQAVDLPEVKTIDGRLTFLARADELGVALDELRLGSNQRIAPAGTLDQLTAVLPDAVAEAMKTALPGRYTPELAADIAETMAAILRGEQRPLTAAQRGPEWMAKWGCPGFCVTEHGQPEALECHSTAPVETSLRAADVDCSGYSANGEELPWMTAQVIVKDTDAQDYGRETRVWLGYGIHLAEISPAEAREALDAMRAFTVRLAAVVDFAEQVAADDYPGTREGGQ